MLHVQEFLRNGGSLDALSETRHVHSSVVGDLVLLNYDQLDSPKADEIVIECRGLILQMGTWDVVAQSFTRFFNAGDPACAKIGWKGARAIEKVDGSLVTLFSYSGSWRIATRGCIDAVGTLPAAPERTFADAIRPLIDETLLDHNYVYVLEFVSPWNRIVKRYPAPALYLLTARDVREDHREVDLCELPAMASPQGWRIPETFCVADIADVSMAIDRLVRRTRGSLSWTAPGTGSRSSLYPI